MRLRRVVVVGFTAGVAEMLTGVEVLDHATLCTDDATVIPSLHTFADPAMVLFTSGTTGPSKGCVLSHRYAVRQAELMIENLRLRHDDVLYCPFPMFHIDATVLTVVPAMLLAHHRGHR